MPGVVRECQQVRNDSTPMCTWMPENTITHATR
jgi:hypothetical protein